MHNSVNIFLRPNPDGFAHIQEEDIPSVCYKVLFPKVSRSHVETFCAWCEGAGKKRVLPVPRHFALPKNLSIDVSRKTGTIT